MPRCSFFSFAHEPRTRSLVVPQSEVGARPFRDLLSLSAADERVLKVGIYLLRMGCVASTEALPLASKYQVSPFNTPIPDRYETFGACSYSVVCAVGLG